MMHAPRTTTPFIREAGVSRRFKREQEAEKKRRRRKPHIPPPNVSEKSVRHPKYRFLQLPPSKTSERRGRVVENQCPKMTGTTVTKSEPVSPRGKQDPYEKKDAGNKKPKMEKPPVKVPTPPTKQRLRQMWVAEKNESKNKHSLRIQFLVHLPGKRG